MTKEERLSEFQREKIKQRSKLNYEEELTKSQTKPERKKFKKLFSNQIDIFVNEMLNNGVIFYGLSIDNPYFDSTNEYNLWKSIHTEIEDWVNCFQQEIELVEFCYLAIEKKNSNYITNGILGVRSLIGENKELFNRIKKELNFHHLDFRLENLKNEIEILDYWNFIVRENNLKFHRFVQYSQHYNDLYCDIADLELQYDNQDHIAFQLEEFKSSSTAYIKGICDLNPDNRSIINYLVNVYMNEKKIYLNKNNLYVKIKQSKRSWMLLGSIDWIDKNNIKIFEFLGQKFPQHFSGLKVQKLFNNAWDEFFKDIRKRNHYLPCIEFDYNIVEYRDGFYHKNEQKFFSDIDIKYNVIEFKNYNFDQQKLN